MKSDIEIGCDLKNLETVREWFKANFSVFVGDEDLFDRLNLGLNEVLSNVIIHANHSDPEKTARISGSIDNGRLEIEIVHCGEAFVPEKQELPDIETLPEGGFGLFLIANAFDQADYFSDSPEIQRIRLSKQIR